MTSKILRLPAFFPDATYAAIHSLPFHEIREKLSGIVVTTLHMKLIGLIELLEKYQQENISYRQLAGLPESTMILSDSGGFQVLSLIYKQNLGKITEEGAIFHPPESPRKKVLLTPELSQQIQHTLKSDIRVVLDVPMWKVTEYQKIKEAVERTTRWAERAKKEFSKLECVDNFSQGLQKEKNQLEYSRPLLVAVVQGEDIPELRKESGNQLSSIGFDIYGFGGWPMDSEGQFNTKIAEAFVDSLPRGSITYGMGVGTPDDIELCHKIGMTIFDAVIPTRNARHGTLYVTPGSGEKAGRTFDLVRISSARYEFDLAPIDKQCDCPTCKNYTRAYIHFLLKKKNPVGYTLASLHNVWWYLSFMQRLGV